MQLTLIGTPDPPGPPPLPPSFDLTDAVEFALWAQTDRDHGGFATADDYELLNADLRIRENEMRRHWINTEHRFDTDRIRAVRALVDRCLARAAGHKPPHQSVSVRGPNRSGKSFAVQEVGRAVHRRLAGGPHAPAGTVHLPVVYAPMIADATPKGICKTIAASYGWDELTSRYDTGDLVRFVAKRVRSHRTRLIILDEIDHVRQGSADANKLIKSLMNACDAVFVFVGQHLPHVIDTGKGSVDAPTAQVKGRVNLYDLKPYELAEPGWRSVVGATVDSLRLHGDNTHLLGDDMLKYLHGRTYGRLSSLVWLLQTAALHTVRDDPRPAADEVVTRELLERCDTDFASEYNLVDVER